MLKNGFYLQGLPQTLEDKSELVKHVIVQVNEPNERGFCEDPVIRTTYLKPDVMDILPSGTPVQFDLDVKLRKTADGRSYEKIVPVEIKSLNVKTSDSKSFAQVVNKAVSK